MILAKAIRAKRFDDAAFKNAMRHALERVGRVAVKEFERTTATWEHKPEFKVSTHVTARLMPPISLEVWTEDKVYGYVSEGTRPHDIWAGAYTGKSNAKVLAFPSAFTPKTKPGSLQSGPGFKGGETVHVPYVHHPGTEARNFDALVTKEVQPKFKKEIEDALHEARLASGHAA